MRLELERVARGLARTVVVGGERALLVGVQQRAARLVVVSCGGLAAVLELLLLLWLWLVVGQVVEVHRLACGLVVGRPADSLVAGRRVAAHKLVLAGRPLARQLASVRGPIALVVAVGGLLLGAGELRARVRQAVARECGGR